jgi:hypothetical protein
MSYLANLGLWPGSSSPNARLSICGFRKAEVQKPNPPCEGCPPSAEEVKELRALVEDEEEARKILNPSKERVSMANVLFCANQIFTSKAPDFLSRRLFIVTNNNNPHRDEKSLRSAAKWCDIFRRGARCQPSLDIIST